MRKTTIVFLAFLMAVIFAPRLSGESIQTKLVPAEAKWLIHFDVEKFAKTELKQILEKNSDHDFSREIMGIEKKTGIDFFSDISSVTVIGMNQEKSEPVVAISGILNKIQLLDSIKEEESLVETTYGSFILYNWDNDGFGVFASDNLLIISENRKGLEKVLDTFSGKEKDFSDTPLQRQLKALSPDTFLVASAENVSALLDEDDDDFGALILKKTESAFFSVNEKNSHVKLQLNLQTDSPETATNMESMVTGLKAFLSMNNQIDPDWDIIKSLKVSAKGTTVVLESQGSVEELLNIIKEKK